MGLVGIYKITSPIGVYIGYSIDLIKREKVYSNNNIQTQPLIKESINVYGWDNHKFEIIEYCSKKDLKIREKYWIRNYDSFNKGLNKNIGGGGPINHSEETKTKMRKPKPEGFGAIISKSTKGKPKPGTSKSLIGKPSHFKNHSHSQESRDKMSLAKKGKTLEEIFGKDQSILLRYKRSLPRKGKTILCSNGNIYSSIKEASNILNISEGSISNILIGDAKQTKNNLKFSYVKRP
jgi:group I intron endonuclease